jgi:ribosome maturation factor RimP
MNSKQICELVWKETEPLAAAAGCQVWDVKFIKEAGEWVLKVFLDTEIPGNVTIDMCEAVNRGLDKRLDELDPIEQSYYLEVSSPGVNRELSRPGDFLKFIGSEVDIKLYKANAAGEKSFTAVLCGLEGDNILLSRDGKDFSLPRSEVASCRIHFDF